MKQQSVRAKVMKFASKNPNGFLAKEVTAAIDAPTKQVATALWALKKNGSLTHSIDDHLYKLTGVNKTVATETPDKPKREASEVVPVAMLNKAHSAYADVVGQLRAERDNHAEEVKTVKEKYEDSLAIIRYLEDKLFRAIQHDARRGRNS